MRLSRIVCLLLVAALSARAAEHPPVAAGAEWLQGGKPNLPLDVENPILTGSFGEYRYTHLHAGVDYSTNYRTGVPVRAVLGGKVFRLRSSVGGYGNVIYIEHANGRRSVYAHLDRFVPRLAQLLPTQPHRLGGAMDGRSMEVFPKEVRVQKGEVIAWSGESGWGGPHLHFEWRDTNDRPINPLTDGIISVPERTAPKLTAITIEPANERSSVNTSGAAFSFGTDLRDVTVRANGQVRLLASGYDPGADNVSRLGLTRIRLLVDGKPWSEIRFDRFSYGRDKESYWVYDGFRTGYSPTMNTYDLTGPDGAAEVLSNPRGFITVETAPVAIRVEAWDLVGNRAHYAFTLSPITSTLPLPPGASEYSGRGGLVIRRDNVEERITAPGRGRFGDCEYLVDESSRSRKAVRLAGGGELDDIPAGLRIASLTNATMPAPPLAVDRPLLVGPVGLRLEMQSTLTLPARNDANGVAVYYNNSWKWLPTKRDGRSFTGDYLFLAPVVLVRDTVPPAVKVLEENRETVFDFTDDFSGIDAESVRIEEIVHQASLPLEGRYDPDRDRFFPHRSPPPGVHIFTVTATDNAGNRMTQELRHQVR